MAIGYTAFPYLALFERQGNAYVRLSNPSTVPSGTVRSCAFSHNGQYLAVGSSEPPHILVYKRSGSTFTKLSTPASLPTDNWVSACAFSWDDTYLALGGSVANLRPYLYVYKRSGDTFTKLTNPPQLGGNSYDTGAVSFSPDGNYLVHTGNQTGEIILYRRTNDSFSQLSFSPVMVGTIHGCAWSPDSQYILFTSTSGLGTVRIARKTGDTSFSSITPPNVPAAPWYPAPGVWTADGTYAIIPPYSNLSGGTLCYRNDGDGVFTRVTMTISGAVCYGKTAISDNGALLGLLSWEKPPYVYELGSTLYAGAITPGGFAKGSLVGLGMALERAAAGQNVKVNLFDPINDAWGGMV